MVPALSKNTSHSSHNTNNITDNTYLRQISSDGKYQQQKGYSGSKTSVVYDEFKYFTLGNNMIEVTHRKNDSG